MASTSLWHDRPADLTRGAVDPRVRYDLLVIGGGLTGLVTALLFARAGHRVALLEGRRLGSVATGNTTAKISLLQGTKLSQIADKHSQRSVGHYVDGNRAGQEWLLDYCAVNGIDVQREDAFTYATTHGGDKNVREEVRAALGAGLPATYVSQTELPYAVTGAVRLPDQAQFDPMDAVTALADDCARAGVHISENSRARKVHRGLRHVSVQTDKMEVTAERVVLATGTPTLDRGGFFSRMEPLRSYAASYAVPGDIPSGMYISADSPSRSLRYAPGPDGSRLLLVGGNGHTVGREASPQAQVDDLDAWTAANFPGAQRTHRWSAQDYEGMDSLPYVGSLIPGDDRITVATGYDKWGMTNAVAAALLLVGRATGREPAWADAYDTWKLRQLTGLVTAGRLNVSVALHLTQGWVAPFLARSSSAPPVEGSGRVERGVRPRAVCTVDGVTRSVSAVCPHLGGILAWNDAEMSWDCPLHGSRFAPDGSILEGPVTSELT